MHNSNPRKRKLKNTEWFQLDNAKIRRPKHDSTSNIEPLTGVGSIVHVDGIPIIEFESLDQLEQYDSVAISLGHASCASFNKFQRPFYGFTEDECNAAEVSCRVYNRFKTGQYCNGNARTTPRTIVDLRNSFQSYLPLQFCTSKQENGSTSPILCKYLLTPAPSPPTSTNYSDCGTYSEDSDHLDDILTPSCSPISKEMGLSSNYLASICNASIAKQKAKAENEIKLNHDNTTSNHSLESTTEKLYRESSLASITLHNKELTANNTVALASSTPKSSSRLSFLKIRRTSKVNLPSDTSTSTLPKTSADSEIKRSQLEVAKPNPVTGNSAELLNSREKTDRVKVHCISNEDLDQNFGFVSYIFRCSQVQCSNIKLCAVKCSRFTLFIRYTIKSGKPLPESLVKYLAEMNSNNRIKKSHAVIAASAVKASKFELLVPADEKMVEDTIKKQQALRVFESMVKEDASSLILSVPPASPLTKEQSVKKLSSNDRVKGLKLNELPNRSDSNQSVPPRDFPPKKNNSEPGKKQSLICEDQKNANCLQIKRPISIDKTSSVVRSPRSNNKNPYETVDHHFNSEAEVNVIGPNNIEKPKRKSCTKSLLKKNKSCEDVERACSRSENCINTNVRTKHHNKPNLEQRILNKNPSISETRQDVPILDLQRYIKPLPNKNLTVASIESYDKDKNPSGYDSLNNRGMKIAKNVSQRALVTFPGSKEMIRSPVPATPSSRVRANKTEVTGDKMISVLKRRNDVSSPCHSSKSTTVKNHVINTDEHALKVYAGPKVSNISSSCSPRGNNVRPLTPGFRNTLHSPRQISKSNNVNNTNIDRRTLTLIANKISTCESSLNHDANAGVEDVIDLTCDNEHVGSRTSSSINITPNKGDQRVSGRKPIEYAVMCKNFPPVGYVRIKRVEEGKLVFRDPDYSNFSRIFDNLEHLSKFLNERLRLSNYLDPSIFPFKWVLVTLGVVEVTKINPFNEQLWLKPTKFVFSNDDVKEVKIITPTDATATHQRKRNGPKIKKPLLSSSKKSNGWSPPLNLVSKRLSATFKNGAGGISRACQTSKCELNESNTNEVARGGTFRNFQNCWAQADRKQKI